MWASRGWTNLDGRSGRYFFLTKLSLKINYEPYRKEKLVRVFDESTRSERRPSGSTLPPRCSAPICHLSAHSSSLLPDSCQQLFLFLLIYSSPFLQTVLALRLRPPLTLLQSPPPLSALPRHSSSSQSFIILFFLSILSLAIVPPPLPSSPPALGLSCPSSNSPSSLSMCVLPRLFA